MQSSRRLRFGWRSMIWVVLLTCPLVGCEVFGDRTGVFGTETKLPSLPALRAAPEAIQLEIVFVERPVGDRLLGESLWREVDQILNLDPEVQRDLERNGFRIGVMGSHPPAALQSMLELNSGFDTPNGEASPKKLKGNRVFLTSGSATDIQVSPVYPECDITLFPAHESETGKTETYQNALCTYHVTVTRVQEGWCRLDFLPQVRHGDERLRPKAGLSAWQLISAQKVEPLYLQQFSVMLNVGEMAVVTARDEMTGTAGQRFFIGPEGEDQVQRMLLVRLSHMSSAEEK